jgi:hypothetical protein
MENFLLLSDVKKLFDKTASNKNGTTNVQQPSRTPTVKPNKTGRLVVDGFVIQDGVLIEYTGPIQDTLVIPNCVDRIGDFSLARLDWLYHVVFPNTIIVIGKNAFEGDDNIRELNLPESVEYIDDGAFAWCTSIKEIFIPKNVKYIGPHAFNAGQWRKFTIDPQNQFYRCENNCVIDIFNKEIVVAGCDSSIPENENVTSIGEYAFEGFNFHHIKIPNNITKIKKYAFTNCYSLGRIILPTGCHDVEELAFNECYNLELNFYGGFDRSKNYGCRSVKTYLL